MLRGAFCPVKEAGLGNLFRAAKSPFDHESWGPAPLLRSFPLHSAVLAREPLAQPGGFSDDLTLEPILFKLTTAVNHHMSRCLGDPCGISRDDRSEILRIEREFS